MQVFTIFVEALFEADFGMENHFCLLKMLDVGDNLERNLFILRDGLGSKDYLNCSKWKTKPNAPGPACSSSKVVSRANTEALE